MLQNMASYNLVNFIATIIIFALFSLISIGEGRLTHKMVSEFFESSSSSVSGGFEETRWAVLIAGSMGYENYRHQADICHAYRIMKRGGVKDQNIIVFMYDDIAYNEYNPKPGVIINHPRGKNLYPGVVKDYTGEAANSSNLYSVLLGDQTTVQGGTGKVLSSGPSDHVFIYYADHGGPGILGMPSGNLVYATDLMNVLRRMHALQLYKKMVIYVEACESGSIFDGLLPNNLNIYAITAANPNELSYAIYCGEDAHTPKEYNDTCLGDVFSVSWMEDSDKHNPMKETLEQQYLAVKNRTAKTSHVMQYGDLSMRNDLLASYMAANPRTRSYTYIVSDQSKEAPRLTVEQRDADLIYYERKVRQAREGSKERMDAQKKLDEVVSHRKHVDQSVENIGKLLFGEANGPSMLNKVRPAGQVLVDDWDCLKNMVNTYEAHCGLLKNYGKKYMRALANMCNAGIHKDQMAEASAQACTSS